MRWVATPWIKVLKSIFWLHVKWNAVRKAPEHLTECLDRWNKDFIKWLFNTLKSACPHTPFSPSAHLHLWGKVSWNKHVSAHRILPLMGWEAVWFNDQRCKGEERWEGEGGWKVGFPECIHASHLFDLGWSDSFPVPYSPHLRVAVAAIPSPSCSVYSGINWGPKQWNAFQGGGQKCTKSAKITLQAAAVTQSTSFAV